MSEKGATGKGLALEEYEKRILERLKKAEEDYENAKSPLWKKFNDYQKNLLCIKDVTDSLLGHMKGHGVSFKSEITDRKGKFSHEKLSGFVEELLSLWAAKQRGGTYTDPSTGESLAEPYIRERLELYSCYLYVVMRCSLNQADYDYVVGGSLKLRTDFAFLLEQAKTILRAWCVMEDPKDGSRKNELFWGYDGHFGLHLYRVLSCPAAGDNGFDWPGGMPVDHPAYLTDEGNVKRKQFRSIYISHCPSLEKNTEKAAQSDEDDYDMEDSYDDENGYDMEDSYDDENGYDMEDSYDDENGYDVEDSYDEEDYYDDTFVYDEWQYEAEEYKAEKQVYLENLPMFFEHSGEYVEKCKRFVELFQQAGHDVIRGFYEDLEEIAALYLIERDIPPAMDTDKALDVYSSIYDEALQHARRYERGIQWKTI